MIEWLVEPFRYSFVSSAVLASCVIGVTCAVLGVYIVLRRMANVGHALTHSALPGLVVAYLTGGNLFAGAAVATIVTALGIGFISKNKEVYEDTAIGIIPTAMFAFGILLMSQAKSFRDLSSMLFGNILGVGSSDLVMIMAVGLMVLGIMTLFHKEFELFSVDPDYARTIGIPLEQLRYMLLVLLALTVVVGIQAVGTVLTNALLIAPAAAARLLTNRLKNMVMIAAGIAIVSSFCGIYLSYYFGLSSGAAIVFVCTLAFAVCWIIKRLRTSS
jgi:ABC-type Mn2+/Zn2+ transport system permease subunit